MQNKAFIPERVTQTLNLHNFPSVDLRSLIKPSDSNAEGRKPEQGGGKGVNWNKSF